MQIFHLKDSLSWRKRLGNGWALLFLLLGAAVFCRSLFLGGRWPVTHEMLHPLVRLFEFDYALQRGQFPVRWCDNLSAGYGYPFFNFYPPLSFMLAEIFHLIGVDLAFSWKLEILLVCWLGALGVFGLLRPWIGRFSALVGALAYLFAPYHVMTLYVRGNIPEFTALCVWPFLFWAIQESLKRIRDWRGPLLPFAAMSVAALILSHVLTSYMAVFNLLLWAMFCSGVFSLRKRKTGKGYPWDKILVSFAIALLGAALAAFFWVPALADLSFCRPVILTDYIRIQDHFVYPWQFIYPGWGWGLSLPGAGDGISFQLGLVAWILVAFAVAMLIKGRIRRGRSLGLFALSMLILHLFLMTPWSLSLWSLFPGSFFMQFPWRLLIPASFWASLISGVAAGEIVRFLKSKNNGLRYGIGGLLLVCPALVVVPYLRPLYFFEEIPVYEAQRLRSIMTNTTADEYLPKWVEKIPERPSSWNIRLEKKGIVKIGEKKSGYHRFLVETNESQAALFDVFWFPGWSVFVDGEWMESKPLHPSGIIFWQMPVGRSEVEIVFSDTPLRRSAGLVSLISLILAVIWLLRCGVRSIASARSQNGRHNR